LRNILIGAAGEWRIDFRSNGAGNYMRWDLFADGRIHLYLYVAGVWQGSLIEAGAGTISDADTCALVADGTYFEIFVNGISVGSSSGGEYLSATSGVISQQPSGFGCDSFEIWHNPEMPFAL
jgi:hypothetical protein